MKTDSYLNLVECSPWAGINYNCSAKTHGLSSPSLLFLLVQEPVILALNTALTPTTVWWLPLNLLLCRQMFDWSLPEWDHYPVPAGKNGEDISVYSMQLLYEKKDVAYIRIKILPESVFLCFTQPFGKSSRSFRGFYIISSVHYIVSYSKSSVANDGL